ncbi:MAG: hypothetical protein ACUVRZ_07615, partial [Desulfobacca sp.]|uniref:hypothetical protein n=1 Tax=Desulfobacca sp. TaxID=2067990 RepID=UPI00404995EC
MNNGVSRGLCCWFSILVLSLSACAHLPTAPAPGRPLVASADELLQQLQDQAATVASLKARGHVSVTSPQKNYAGNVLLTAAKPAKLRVDILNFWGQSLLTFLTDGQEMQLLVYGDRKLYKGPATPENLGRFLPVVVSQEDFLAALTGHIAFHLYEKPVLLASPEPAVYLLELTRRDLPEKVKLTVATATLQILTAQWLGPAGQETLRAEFSNFLESVGGRGPSDIRLASG